MARRVGEVLKDNGFFPEVGGMQKGLTPQSHTINANVIEQMERASIAIILVQKLYREAKPTNEFRPNLMFEWGYLTRRLRNDCIHIYLIGVQPKDLPTDLIGGYTHEVHLQNYASPTPADIDATAQAIVQHFISDSASIDLDGLEVLQRYDHFRAQLAEVAKSKSQFSARQIGYVVLHMLQPAFYRNDLQFIADCMRDLSTRATSNFNEIMILAQQVIAYYEATDSLMVQPGGTASAASTMAPQVRKLIEIDRTLHVLASNRNRVFNIFDVLVDNFRGLANLRLAELNSDNSLLNIAMESFESALRECRQFRSIHLSNENFVRLLWQAYIERNLSRVYHLKGEAALAKTHGHSAEAARVRVQALLSSAGIPWLARQFDIEIGLTKFDQAVAAGVDKAALTSIVEQFLLPHTPRGVDRVWDRLHAAVLKEVARNRFASLETRLRNLSPA